MTESHDVIGDALMDEKGPAVTEPPVTSPVNPHVPVTDPASADETGTETWFDKHGGQLVPYPQVRQRWAAHTSSFDAMIDELGEDVFAECYPWLTHANVHTGSVYVPGDLHLDMDQVFVIDGDLTIGGVLRISASFEYPALVITGDLRARHLLTEFHARLLVLGSLHLDGVLVCDSSDAAEIEILGASTADACIITDTSIDFGQPPTLTHADADLLDELWDIDALHKALRDGLQVLRTASGPGAS